MSVDSAVPNPNHNQPPCTLRFMAKELLSRDGEVPREVIILALGAAPKRKMVLGGGPPVGRRRLADYCDGWSTSFFS
jgi:hypothetical protein